MTTTLIAETTSHTSHLGISFSIDTRLSDYDQIVIDVPHLEYQMLSTGWSRVNTGNVKFRLERIRYSLTNETFALCSIEGRGFTKSGSLRVRETNFWTKDLIAYPEILAQIPTTITTKQKNYSYKVLKNL
jgi:hypothetical protein